MRSLSLKPSSQNTLRPESSSINYLEGMARVGFMVGLTWGGFLLNPLHALAQSSHQIVKFQDDELSQETVLPALGNVPAVKNRSINMSNKWELTPGFGWNFTEPIYNPLKLTVQFGYHWSEQEGINIQYTKWSAGRNSQYSSQLEGPGIALKLDRIPNIDSSLFVNYERRFFYGKMSITKETIMHMHLYPLLGLGTTKYVHKNYFGANAGLGTKFFMTTWMAFRADFYFQFIQAPNPFSVGEQLAYTNVTLQNSDFSDKWTIGNNLDLGLSFFF